MKLQDISDMKDYLENRCYNPGEIYDLSGFFYQVFKPETECEYFTAGIRGAIHGHFVLATAPDERCREQIIYIEVEGEDAKVASCVRVDATEHNKQEILKFLHRRIDKMSFDEYDPGSTEKTLKEIFGFADAIEVSG